MGRVVKKLLKKKKKRHNESSVDAQIGDIANISREQVRKIEKLKESCSEEEIKKLRAGKDSIHKKISEKKRVERKQELPNEIAVKRWIIATSFNRRNLPIEERLRLAFEDTDLEALQDEAKERKWAGEKIDHSQPVGTGGEKGRILEKVGAIAECSHETVRQYKKIKEEKLEKRIADGESIKKDEQKIN